MTYNIVKALHLISFTCWFAGLFYVVRLFVYNTESRSSSEPHALAFQRQFNTMQHRLWYGITWPAMLCTLGLGVWLVVLIGGLTPWLHLKLAWVVGLVGYHLLLGRIHRQLKADISRWSPRSLRMLNEGATLFLVAIVFTAVLKSSLTPGVALAVMGTLGVLLAMGFLVYQRLRKP